MTLVLPYAMRDNEPVIMKLGAPVRLLAPKIAAAEAAAAAAREINERTQREFDPWFRVEPPSKEIDNDDEPEFKTSAKVSKSRAVKIRKKTGSSSSSLLKQKEDEQKEENTGRTVWVVEHEWTGPDP